MKIAGKTALVTGGAHRVGKGIALGLAEAGANLVLHYRSSAGLAEETAEEARRFGVGVELRPADLSDPESVAAVVAPPLDILVNSAAGFASDGLLDVTLEQWHSSFALNVTAPMLLTQAFARNVPEDGAGVVVNVTDWKTHRPYRRPKFSYTVSKGAIDTLTRVAAAELAPRIRVNAVALGAILPPADASSGESETLAALSPLGRLGGVDVVARAVVSLIENDFVTGEILRVDGGAHLI